MRRTTGHFNVINDIIIDGPLKCWMGHLRSESLFKDKDVACTD